ncbi:hypothetical protein HN51_031419, partial [Arachis hypogaea]
KEYSGSARTGDGSVRRDQVGLAGQNTQYFIGVQLDGSQQLEPLHNCIADDTAKEGQLLVKQTAENVDDAVRELPDANMIILGSSSKARRQILAEMGYEFTIMTADIDEKSNWKEKPEDLVMALAEAKVCDQNKVNGSGVEIVSDEVKSKSFRKAKYDDEMPPNIDLDEWDHTASRTDLAEPPVFGSSRPCPVSSGSLTIFNSEDELNPHPSHPGSLINRNETQQRRELLNASFDDRVPIRRREGNSKNRRT